MATLGEQLDLDRCPHCSVDCPSLVKCTEFNTSDYQGSNGRCWRIYRCTRCGGVVTAAAINWGGAVFETYPSSSEVDASIPERARNFLTQAMNSLHAPSGVIMLAASSVDAMLKARGYKDGSLYDRIDEAAEKNMITKEMSQWAHEVRLDANDQRHDDESRPLPDSESAKKAIDFVNALGTILFVLPARVQRGLQNLEAS